MNLADAEAVIEFINAHASDTTEKMVRAAVMDPTLSLLLYKTVGVASYAIVKWWFGVTDPKTKLPGRVLGKGGRYFDAPFKDIATGSVDIVNAAAAALKSIFSKTYLYLFGSSAEDVEPPEEVFVGSYAGTDFLMSGYGIQPGVQTPASSLTVESPTVRDNILSRAAAIQRKISDYMSVKTDPKEFGKIQNEIIATSNPIIYSKTKGVDQTEFTYGNNHLQVTNYDINKIGVHSDTLQPIKSHILLNMGNHENLFPVARIIPGRRPTISTMLDGRTGFDNVAQGTSIEADFDKSGADYDIWIPIYDVYRRSDGSIYKKLNMKATTEHRITVHQPRVPMTFTRGSGVVLKGASPDKLYGVGATKRDPITNKYVDPLVVSGSDTVASFNVHLNKTTGQLEITNNNSAVDAEYSSDPLPGIASLDNVSGYHTPGNNGNLVIPKYSSLGFYQNATGDVSGQSTVDLMNSMIKNMPYQFLPDDLQDHSFQDFYQGLLKSSKGSPPSLVDISRGVQVGALRMSATSSSQYDIFPKGDKFGTIDAELQRQTHEEWIRGGAPKLLGTTFIGKQQNVLGIHPQGIVVIHSELPGVIRTPGGASK